MAEVLYPNGSCSIKPFAPVNSWDAIEWLKKEVAGFIETDALASGMLIFNAEQIQLNLPFNPEASRRLLRDGYTLQVRGVAVFLDKLEAAFLE